MSKLFAYATRIVLALQIYFYIGGYRQVTWRDISAHFFLWFCCELVYTNNKNMSKKGE